MRKLAICTALLAILSSGTVSAKNDFDALLGELTFGGSSDKGTQTLTLDTIAADNLAPAPNAQVSAQAPVTDPIPTPQPLTMPHPEADLAADQNVGVEPSLVGEPTIVDELAAPFTPAATCDSSGCCGNQQCGGCRGCQLFGNKDGCHCVPHTPPNLPISSLYEYFKSNACNCRVWDGYQNRCVYLSKHSRGECDCFQPRKQRSCLNGVGCNLGRGVCLPSPAKCQADGCHDLPPGWGKVDCAGEATCGASASCDRTGCDGCDG